MEKSPLVSLVLILKESNDDSISILESFVNQTYPDIELIILNCTGFPINAITIDFLSNGVENRFSSVQLIDPVKEAFIDRLWEGIAVSKGNYLAISDCHCTFLPDRISAQVSLMEESSEIGAVYSDGFLTNDIGKRVGYYSEFNPVPLFKNYEKEVLIGNWIFQNSILFKRYSLLRVSRPNKVNRFGLTDLFIAISKTEAVFYVDKPLFELKYAIAPQQSLLVPASGLNLDFKVRKWMREAQIRFKASNLTIISFMLVIIMKVINSFGERWKSFLYRAKGYQLGKGVKINGSISLSGLKSKLRIGENVKLTGNINIILNTNFNKDLVIIEENCVLENNCTLFAHGGALIIEKGCFIGPNVHIQAKGGVTIGENSMIAAQTNIFASNHSFRNNGKLYKEQIENFEGIIIGRNCWIGANCVILDGTVIGDNSIVGAHSLVKGSYPAYSKILTKMGMAQAHPMS